jgi:hypothetical protein
VLHISTHGEKDHLGLVNDTGATATISAAWLGHILRGNDRPRLVILGACNSAEIAEELRKVVPLTIGFTLPVSTAEVRASVTAFYEALFSGKSVQEAYDISDASLKDLRRSDAQLVLKHRPDTDARLEVPYPAVELVACFPKDKPPKGMNRDGLMRVKFGLANCPSSTTQVIFFTNDRYWVGREDAVDAGDMSTIVVDDPSHTSPRKTLWDTDEWHVPYDFDMFACGLTGDGRNMFLRSGTGDALLRNYRKTSGPASSLVRMQDVEKAVAALRRAKSS